MNAANVPVGLDDGEMSGDTGTISLRGPALERRVLRDVEIFKYLSDEQMKRVASLGQQVQVLEGKVLGEQGEPGYFLFVTIEGKAELSVPWERSRCE